MMDIALCINQNCPLRLRCLRGTAQSNSTRQSYINFEPRRTPDGWRCDYYIKAARPIVQDWGAGE